MKFLSLLLMSLLLSACSVKMTKQECFHPDWVLLGDWDAKHGRTRGVFAQRKKQCETYQGAPSADERKYFMGYEKGLTQFCTFDSGYNFALEGNHYSRTCPAPYEADFLTGYNSGRRELDNRVKEKELRQRELELMDREDKVYREELQRRSGPN